MAFTEQVGKLVDKLTALSQEGKVAWEETADTQAFQAVVSKFVVTVRSGRTGLTYEPDYMEFEVLDQQGKLIDHARGAYAGAEWTKLNTLWELARRHALHADEALTELLSALE